MLVLGRKMGQSITFPELGIVITVIQQVGSQVRLGIEAPREVTVMRTELLTPGSDGSEVRRNDPPAT